MYARQVARDSLGDIKGEMVVDFAKLTDLPSLKELFSNEYLFLDEIFKIDSKNYHAWSHKYWLVERYSLAGDLEHRI